MHGIRKPALVFVLATALSSGLNWAGGDANFLFGQKSLSEDLFDSAGVDGQSQFGVAVTLDFDWPVMLAIDLLMSSDDKTRDISTSFPLQVATDVDTTELDVGVRKFWERNQLRPYVGGGLAYVQLDAKQVESGSLGPGADFSDTIVDDDDSAVGFWLGGGLLYQATPRFQVGLDLRMSDADADLSGSGASSGIKLDSGGFHYGILLGYHW